MPTAGHNANEPGLFGNLGLSGSLGEGLSRLGLNSTEDILQKQCEWIRSHNSTDEILQKQCEWIRKAGRPFLEEVAKSVHPKSKVATWDPNVYAGVMEQMDADSYFQWTDVHWSIPKPELLKRVDEWNDALERYADSEGLVGAEREDVIKLHTASHLAPCANIHCDKYETSVKEFSRCQKCLLVSYCSRSCQKEDYLPRHKQRCVKR